MMQCLYIICIGSLLVKASSGLRSISEHKDTGECTGEFKPGNSPFVPHHYSLYLELEPSDKKFQGEVNITGTLEQQVDSIELHSVNLNITTVKVNGENIDGAWDNNITFGILGIQLPTDVLKSNPRELTVSVFYEGYFNDKTGVIMQYYNKTDENRWIIFSHLEPISARTVFPCIDLPKYKAKFDISIKNSFPGPHPRTILSNMPPIASTVDKEFFNAEHDGEVRMAISPSVIRLEQMNHEEHLKYQPRFFIFKVLQFENGMRIVKFQTTPLMSTYLVSFVVSDYKSFNIGHSLRYSRTGVFTEWAPKEMMRKHGTRFLISMIQPMIEILEEFTGHNYSLPKLDIFVVMDKPGIGGMENWGLIMYQVDSAVHIKRTSASNLVTVLFTIVHELAHNWYGNSVTTADWCGMWFQEAIPTYLHGRLPFYHSFDLDMINRVKWTARKEVMDVECFLFDDSTPLRDLDNPRGDERTLFSLSRYYKGANLLFMVESMVTPKVFRKALQSFYVRYNNSFATENDLWDMVVMEVRKANNHGAQIKWSPPATLGEIAETWVTNRSHPIVVLNRLENGTVWLGQRVCLRKFLMEGEWYIPISYTTSRNPNFENTMPQGWVEPMYGEFKELGDVRLNDDEWIILNIEGSGFYRVQYDHLTWKLILEQLKRDARDMENAVIPPLHRAMLIDDSFHTANKGEELVKVFELMEYVKADTSTYVWEALVVNVGFQYGQFPKEVGKLFKKYVQFLLKDVFDKVTNTTDWYIAYFEKVESFNDKCLRAAVFDLSSTVELPKMKKSSRDIALKVINGKMEDKIIPADITTKMWCAAISTGDQSIFDYVLSAYNGENNDKKKAQIFESLQCSNEQITLLLNLKKTTSDGNKETLLRTVKDILLRNWPDKCYETLSFIAENTDDLIDDKSQLGSELQDYVRNPLDECKPMIEKIFGANFTTDGDDEYLDWNEMYGTEPLKWLNDHKHEWHNGETE